ncbi:RidA family protein [Crossiella sp. SN42]|uniref:RidA family protein n=1 Tax=Crossiella sp. SN42 TaxID=2944808 RepID=UPI00207CAC1C|nr:RidA family protein [Crossiella sp. SN42]MCO1577144.1 RidA family protein [Crossiella sp. SN42]
MSHRIINPEGLHDPLPFGYSHVAVTSGELVFIAGQYASDATGQVSTPDFAAQVDLAFANLRTALAAAGLELTHVVQLRTHIVNHDLGKLEVLGKAISAIWGDQPPVQTLTGVASLALPGMLFEVDAVAARP